jgi:Xaa-Pro aminopeptidase
MNHLSSHNPHITACQQRRVRLAQNIQAKSGSGVVILSTAEEKARNRDSDFPYRHDSDFFYLTGFDEPGATLVMLIQKTGFESHLFCRPKDLEREIWDGYRLGPEAAPEILHLDAAYSNTDLGKKLPEFLANQNAIYVRLASNAQVDHQIRDWMSHVRQQARAGTASPEVFHNIESLIHEMRLFKDPSEIETMRQAAAISAEAHIRAMRSCKPGKREYQLEAELLYEFRYRGAQSVAYNSIVAAGANTCVLHHRASSAELLDGDLCLIDAGCELNGYASDITRTFPINGRYSASQRALYDITLAAQESAVAETRPGKTFIDPHNAAVRVLTQGLLDEKLIKLSDVGSLDNAIELGAYKRFYMHRTSHWLGMDVHDVGSYRESHINQQSDQEKPWRVLKKDMVLTIEPGLYIRPADDIPKVFWNIGIRIEDDAIVTDQGCALISRGVPVDPLEIEAIVRS